MEGGGVGVVSVVCASERDLQTATSLLSRFANKLRMVQLRRPPCKKEAALLVQNPKSWPWGTENQMRAFDLSIPKIGCQSQILRVPATKCKSYLRVRTKFYVCLPPNASRKCGHQIRKSGYQCLPKSKS
jgi:hypothetical protein